MPVTEEPQDLRHFITTAELKTGMVVKRSGRLGNQEVISVTHSPAAIDKVEWYTVELESETFDALPDNPYEIL